MNSTSVKSVAHDLQSESRDRAQRIARSLFGDVPYGAENLSKQEFLAMLRRNWGNPGYRQALGGYYDQQGLYHAGRISPEAFLTAAAEAGVIGDWKGSLNGA